MNLKKIFKSRNSYLFLKLNIFLVAIKNRKIIVTSSSDKDNELVNSEDLIKEQEMTD